MKAFEEATGLVIDENQKKVANEEIIKTGELGEVIGQEEASKLINLIKNEIVSRGIKSPEDITNLIIESADKLDLSLTENQIEALTSLMEKISKLDLNTEEIKDQLKNITDKISDTIKNNPEVKGILARIFDAIKAFFKALFGK